MTTINRHIQFNRGELSEYKIQDPTPKSGEPIAHPFYKVSFDNETDTQTANSSMLMRLGNGYHKAQFLNYAITNKLLQVNKLRFTSGVPVSTSWSDIDLTTNVEYFAEDGTWEPLTSGILLSWDVYSVDTDLDFDTEGSTIYDHATINPIIINADYPNGDLNISPFLDNHRLLKLSVKADTNRTINDLHLNAFIYQPFIDVVQPTQTAPPIIEASTDKLWVGFGDSKFGQLGIGNFSDTINTPRPLFLTEPNGSFSNLKGNEYVDTSDWSPAIGKYHTIIPTTVSGVSNLTIFAAGNNKYGQISSLDNPTRTNQYIDITSHLINNVCVSGKIISMAACNKSSAFIALCSGISGPPSGYLYTMGENSYAQLGLGDIDDRDYPTLVSTNFGVSGISMGQIHGILRSASGVYAWGNNTYAQCGQDPSLSFSISEPQFVASGTTAIDDVAAGGFHSMYITDNKTRLFAFGKNDFGQLGVRHNTNIHVPELVRLTNPNAVVLNTFPQVNTVQFNSMSIGGNTIEQIAFNGTVGYRKYLLGRNSGSRLPETYVFTNVPSTHPIAFIGINQANVSGDNYFTCRQIDGVDYKFYYGTITITASIIAPITIVTCDINKNINGTEILLPFFDDNYQFVDVKCGLNHSVIMVKDLNDAYQRNIVFTCGNNFYGQLGTGDYIDRNYCYLLPSYWKSIAAGDNHTVLVSYYNAVFVTGDNSSNQLGLGEYGPNKINMLTQLDLQVDIFSCFAGSDTSILLSKNL
jgi:alpha-tubulin suppressor-like RCC1 family protein